MKKYLVTILISLLLQSIAAQKPQIYQDTIPFRNDLGLIIIPHRI